MNKIAQFHKVSFEQFKKDWQGEHPQDGKTVFQELQMKRSKQFTMESNFQREQPEDQQDTIFLVRLILH